MVQNRPTKSGVSLTIRILARDDLRNDHYAKHSGINKGGRTLEELMPKSGSPMRYGVAVAGAGQPSPISWLDSPGDLVRLKFSNI